MYMCATCATRTLDIWTSVPFAYVFVCVFLSFARFVRLNMCECEAPRLVHTAQSIHADGARCTLLVVPLQYVTVQCAFVNEHNIDFGYSTVAWSGGAVMQSCYRIKISSNDRFK